MREVLFDIETDGLLPEVSKIWVVCLRIIEDEIESPTYSYVGDEIDDAIGIIEEADMVVGHNILGYDLKVLDKLYDDFNPKSGQVVRDTQVMSQMYFANEKDKDYQRFAKGTLEGKLIGRFGLEAWGQRLGHYKGDYSKEMIAEGRDPWKDFDFERGVPYCEDDIEVNSRLWRKIKSTEWAHEAIVLEHQITEVMHLAEGYGFHFNVEEAKKLEAEVTAEYDELTTTAVDHFGRWYSPEKKYKGDPREHFGEDDSRRLWGEVTVPKKARTMKPTEETPWPVHFSPDSPYCKVKIMEFNPNSRPQIINRLTTIYEWEPVDFTEKGNPEVNDEVLRGLAKDWPICDTLAELFVLSKLLGQLSNGPQAWLKVVDENGFIHARTNPGGTRSGRASHSSPNIAQVPRVTVVKVKDDEGGWNPKVLDENGEPIADCFDEEGCVKKNVILKGRRGGYGWECRNLFDAPVIGGEQWWLMGCDLKGVELRCFAHHLAEFDGGDYVKEVLEGDPHTKNMHAAQLNSRDNAKTFLYATLYGAGDEKIGSIVCPPNTPARNMKQRGRELKAKFQEGLPAYRALMRKIAKQAKHGHLTGLDGRKLWVKSPHSALNLQLQSDGALLAKKWVVLFVDAMEEDGYVFGWDGDFVVCGWIHDEIQVACRSKELAEYAAELAKACAVKSGEHFEYKSPIEADAKVGLTWAQTH